MTVTTSFRTRRSFLGSLIGAAAGFRGLVPVDLAGRVGHLDSLHNFAADAAQIHAPEGAIEFESSDIDSLTASAGPKPRHLPMSETATELGRGTKQPCPAEMRFACGICRT